MREFGPSKRRTFATLPRTSIAASTIRRRAAGPDGASPRRAGGSDRQRRRWASDAGAYAPRRTTNAGTREGARRRRRRHPAQRPLRGFRRANLRGRSLEPVSVGDYVLSGGELGAMVLLDACVRLLPGVMGAASSGEEESFETGLLEYPHYTRPVEWEGRTIPEVLRSGDHAKIATWRHERAIEDTRLRRPDLIERHGGASQAPPSGAQGRDTKADLK